MEDEGPMSKQGANRSSVTVAQSPSIPKAEARLKLKPPGNYIHEQYINQTEEIPIKFPTPSPRLKSVNHNQTPIEYPTPSHPKV